MNRILFALRVLPALLAAAAELRRLAATTPVHQMPDTLRQNAKPLPAALRRPAELAALSDRLSPFLPPRGLGPCLRKSLLVLVLWSRCGLEAKLHLGAQQGEGPCPDFHAWVSAGENEHGRGGHQELWSG